MHYYTVHEPPEPPLDRIDRAGSLTFIGDRFSPIAVALGPLWLLANRLWHALAIYLAALIAIAGIVLVADLGWRWLALMLSALNLIVGFEAASLRRWALERRGWRTLGLVSGRSIDECERRFLETWLPEQRMLEGAGSIVGAAPGPGSRLAAMATGNSGGRLGGDGRRAWLPWRGAR